MQIKNTPIYILHPFCIQQKSWPPAVNAHGQLDHIEGGANELMPPVPSTRTPGNSGADARESQAEVDKVEEDDMKTQRGFEIIHARWRQNKVTIKQAIANMVPDSIFNRIKMKTTAKEVWDALVDIYEARSLMVAIDLRKQLEGLKCGERDDFQTHFDKPGEQREKLASVGIELPDTEYVNIILGSMPSSYDPTISSMTAAASLSSKPLTPKIVMKVILDEYDCRGVSRKKSTKVGEKNAAFSARVWSETEWKAIRCFNCGKEGHKKADCWAPGEERRDRPHVEVGVEDVDIEEDMVEMLVMEVLQQVRMWQRLMRLMECGQWWIVRHSLMTGLWITMRHETSNFSVMKKTYQMYPPRMLINSEIFVLRTSKFDNIPTVCLIQSHCALPNQRSQMDQCLLLKL